MPKERFTIEDYEFCQLVLNTIQASGCRGEVFKAICIIDRFLQQKINLMTFYKDR